MDPRCIKSQSLLYLFAASYVLNSNKKIIVYHRPSAIVGFHLSSQNTAGLQAIQVPYSFHLRLSTAVHKDIKFYLGLCLLEKEGQGEHQTICNLLMSLSPMICHYRPQTINLLTEQAIDMWVTFHTGSISTSLEGTLYTYGDGVFHAEASRGLITLWPCWLSMPKWHRLLNSLL